MSYDDAATSRIETTGSNCAARALQPGVSEFMELRQLGDRPRHTTFSSFSWLPLVKGLVRPSSGGCIVWCREGEAFSVFSVQ